MGSLLAGVAGSRMAVSVVVRWAASRSAVVVADGLGGLVVGGFEVGGTVLAGLIVTPVTLVAGYYLAIGTFRFGLDPDDQSVPIITSVMDLAGVAVVLFVMTSLGVLPNG